MVHCNGLYCTELRGGDYAETTSCHRGHHQYFIQILPQNHRAIGGAICSLICTPILCWINSHRGERIEVRERTGSMCSSGLWICVEQVSWWDRQWDPLQNPCWFGGGTAVGTAPKSNVGSMVGSAPKFRTRAVIRSTVQFVFKYHPVR